jgi:hypothetical protein
LVEIEFALALRDVTQDVSPRIDGGMPLYIVHDTADGMIYSRAERRGRTWFARHWGKQLSGERRCASMVEANEFLGASFREMFPEHRCTSRCRVNPHFPGSHSIRPN